MSEPPFVERLNTWMTLPVPSTFMVPSNSYLGISPAGLSPSTNDLTGLPLTSTHTVTGFLVDGLKM